MRKYERVILLRVLLLPLTFALSGYLIYFGHLSWFMAMIPVLIYQLTDIYRFQKKAYTELEQFTEAVYYRDFSRNFDIKHSPTELRPLRKSFNTINASFKQIAKEKETQYQYLQQILQLVDTGILSYETTSGDVVWMNDTLKRMLALPYLKTIHSLKKRDENLYAEIIALKPGNSKVATLHGEKIAFKVLISATAFQTDGKKYKLIAFQNVNEALDETESKAWQKLLNVMTHEIMNSIAPISSLASTLKKLLKDSHDQPSQAGVLEDLELGIDTIHRRSEGLLKFAETYRHLNKITTLNLKKIHVRDLFANQYRLMQPTFEQKNIHLEIIMKDPDLVIDADINLVEQVLINLLVNAMEAVKDVPAPQIIFSAQHVANEKVMIRVTDNGCGMSEEMADKIFIPFFSTKKNGSGIGLSLCKQIMLLHGGQIQAQSVPGQGSAFILLF